MPLYDVTLNGKNIGSVCETYKGLYTCFQCQCQLPDTQVYRLRMVCGKQETDLGICVPMGSQFVANKRIQSKQIAEGERVFQIVPNSETSDEIFVPVSCNKPFAYISMLKYVRLCNDSTRYGILFKSQPKSK